MRDIEPGTYRLMGFLAAVCALLLIAQSWRERYFMNEDGMSYLDMADRLLLHDSGAWLHPYWSPLYPGLLAVTFKLIQPDLAAKFPVVQLLNCLIGLGALATFTFFLMQWLRLREAGGSRPVVLFAYTCFLWGCLEVTGIQAVTPDMLINALVFLVAGLVCLLSRREDRWGSATWLGIVLGVMYLTKAVMLLFGTFLLVLLWTPWFSRVRRRDVVAAGLVFLAIAGVQIGILSAHLGKLTFGESGRINYAWFIQGGIPPGIGWTGGPLEYGYPAHGPRIIQQRPRALEFSYEEAAGTYPPWYDPVFFHEGIQIHFDLGKHLAVLSVAPNLIRWSHGRSLYPLLAGLLILAWFARGEWAWDRFRERVWLVLWPVAAIGVYAAVFVTARYLAPFLVLFWLGIYELAGPARISRKAAAVYVVAAFFIASISVRAVLSTPAAPTEHVVAAQELARVGLQAGDSIATLGKGIDDYYAHLARLRIVADVEPEDSFWNLPRAEAEALEQKLRQAGARAIVSQHACPASVGAGWRELGRSGYCLKILPN